MKTYDEIFKILVDKAGNESKLAVNIGVSKASVNLWNYRYTFPKSAKNVDAICKYAGISAYELLYAIEKEKEAKCRMQAQKYMQKFQKEKQCKKNK